MQKHYSLFGEGASEQIKGSPPPKAKSLATSLHHGSLASDAALLPSAPLWQRIPKKDRQGRLLSDFMMLIPGLKRRSEPEIRVKVHAIRTVLRRYDEVIALVELNLRINTLWVSLESRPGLCLEIPLAIQTVVPEALLIGQRPDR